MAHLRSRYPHLVAIVAATLAALAGCSKSPSPEHKSEAPAPAVNVEWTKFVDEFIEAYFVANPSFAVASGRHEFDGQMPRLDAGRHSEGGHAAGASRGSAPSASRIRRWRPKSASSATT